MILLDLGCGEKTAEFEGYHVFGIDRKGGDVRADVRSLPIRSESIDYLYACHVIEHLPPVFLLPCLAEWKRVLRIGGIVWIRCPDFKWACRRVLENGLDYQAAWTIFGDLDAGDSSYLIHRFGFTVEHLSSIITQAGLKLLEVKSIGNAIWPGEKEGQEIHLYAQKP